MKTLTMKRSRLGLLLRLGAAFSVLLLSYDLKGRESPSWSPKENRSQHRLLSGAAELLPVLYAAHNRGNIQLALANNGTFGTYGQDISDPFTGKALASCVYPKNSDLVYLWVGAFWIGAVVDEDTLVSSGTDDFYEANELWPVELECSSDRRKSGFCYFSVDERDSFYSPQALSEQDILCWYTDTVTQQPTVRPDAVSHKPHRPLNIKVRQRSMSWSYAYADDFILFDYEIQNIGENTLNDVYMGVWIDGDVWHISRNNPDGWNDDLVGFYRHHPAPEGCGFVDTVNLAFHADNDGDPAGLSWDGRSTRSAVGVRVVRTPAESLAYSFNWWIINYSDSRFDFGPRRAPTKADGFRNMQGRLGTPVGDANKYYVMRRPEFDYDLLFTAIDHSDSGWLMPPSNATTIAGGWDTRYLLSFGPFTVSPGEQLPISFAWVGGENFHKEPDDFERFFHPYSPEVFYSHLNFNQLAVNSRWASWVYDNPGVDTDGDGYAGKFRVCVLDSVIDRIDTSFSGTDTLIDTLFRAVAADTFYYEGDNAPDFRGASPPPSPHVRLIPQTGQMTVRWNGYNSETTKDVFLGRPDFEGYRVYLGLDDRPGSLSVLASYDREDYNRFFQKRSANGAFEWVLLDVPFTVDSLRAMFGDPEFDPGAWPRYRPYVFKDSLFYFAPQDFNASDLGKPGGIRRAYDDVSEPPEDTLQWTEEMVTYEHGRRLPKYYEYEYVIPDLLPTIPYYVAVTAFDFGSPMVGLQALETSPYNNFIAEYPLVSADSVEEAELEAYVYPNPYRIDGAYAGLGYENRERIDPERARRIHFANLPKVCTISIYSLDGDLVRRIEHSYPEGGPGAMHESWDMITRNTQSVVSGIYYWVVESSLRTQLGTLVIIK